MPKHNMTSIRLQNALFLSRMILHKPVFLMRLAAAYFRVLVLKQTPLRFMDIAFDYSCNMTCEHCSAVSLKQKDKPQLTAEEYGRIAKTLRREGCLVFHFTGGEPLLRDDLPDVIRAFKPSRCTVSVQTNGQLATHEKLVALKKAGVDIFCVSIDSGIPEEHDAFRRTKGAFDKAMAALDLAASLGFRTSISTCLSHNNLKSEGLMRVIEIAEKKGIWVNFNLAVPAGNWQENTSFLLTPEDRIYMENLMAEHPCCRTDFSSNYFRWGCSAIKEKLYLTAYGDVMPCPFIQISFGNVREEHVSKIRKRGLGVKVFKGYPQICLAAEDREFIAKCECYSNYAGQLPMPYNKVDWIVGELNGGAK
ncbi:MAG: radical SAM protein [bacterium]